jgi:hypothetical protein
LVHACLHVSQTHRQTGGNLAGVAR